MGEAIIVEARLIGRRRKLLDDWSVSLPPEWGRGDDGVTLRDLISRIVLESVNAFRARQASNQFVRALTERQIEEGAAKGKIDCGGRPLQQEVQDDAAVGNALQAFEDGLYLVVIDGQQQTSLDAPVYLRPDSRVAFIRLVMLAGG